MHIAQINLWEWDQPRILHPGINEHLCWRYEEYYDARRGLRDKWNVQFARGWFY